MKPEDIKQAIKDSLPEGEDICQFIPDVHSERHNYALAVTSNRLIICKKGFIKHNYSDYPGIKLERVKLEEGMWKSSVTFELKGGEKLNFERLDKDSARKLCGFARTMIAEADSRASVAVKICPDCGAQLKKRAKVCPYCEYQFSEKTID
jgi:ribosomal protein L40E